jgi:hypothetical protein
MIHGNGTREVTAEFPATPYYPPAPTGFEPGSPAAERRLVPHRNHDAHSTAICHRAPVRHFYLANSVMYGAVLEGRRLSVRSGVRLFYQLFHHSTPRVACYRHAGCRPHRCRTGVLSWGQDLTR